MKLKKDINNQKNGTIYDTSKEKLGSTVTLASKMDSVIESGQKSEEITKLSRRKIIIEPVMTLYLATFSALAPLQSQYILSVWMKEFNATVGPNSTGQCGEVDKNSTFYIQQQKAQAASAQTSFILDITASIPMMIVALFLGSFSDRNGRRIALITPLVGAVLRISVFLIQMATQIPIWVFTLGTFLDGITGSVTVMQTSCYAYISDTVPKDKRSFRILILECCQCALQAVLQLSMGYLIKGNGYFWPMVMLLGFHLINLVYVIFFVPESRAPTAEAKNALTPMMIIESFKTVTRKRDTPQPRSLLLLCLMGFGFLVFGQTPQYGIENIYLLNTPLCMDSILVGFWKTARLLIFFLTMTVFSRFILPIIGDLWVVFISCVSHTAYYMLFPFCTEIWMAFLILVPGFASRMNLPVARTILSKLVSPDEQGGLISVLYVMESAAVIGGSAMFNNVYAATLNIFRGTTHMMMAGFVLMGMAQFMLYKCKKRKAQHVSEKQAKAIQEEITTQRF